MTTNDKTPSKGLDRKVECVCGVILELRTQGLYCPPCRARSRSERKRSLDAAWRRHDQRQQRHMDPTYADGPSADVGELIEAVGRLVDVLGRHIIEEASINVLNLYRRGADVLDLSEWTSPKDSPVGYRLTPLLAEGLPNMIFGDGGVGKSMVALWLSTMVTEGMQEPFECNPGNVLYLDWEMEAEETQGRLGRIAEGMGLPTPPRVFYRRCAGRLVDDVEWLAETVQSKGIDLVVVDSAVPACGGNPNEPESVQSLFYGLRQLEVTSLIVAHVSKSVAAGPQTSPFGSVFWSNLSRNVWQAQKEQEMGEDSMVVALWHRKTNVGPLLKPVTLKITFSPSFSVERVAAGEYKTLASKLPLAERMAAALGNGAMSSSALAEAIDAKTGSVRVTLNRRDDLFLQLDGNRWGLKARQPRLQTP